MLATWAFQAMMSKTPILEDLFFFFSCFVAEAMFFDVGPNFEILAVTISHWTTRIRKKNASWGIGFRVKRKKYNSVTFERPVFASLVQSSLEYFSLA